MFLRFSELFEAKKRQKSKVFCTKLFKNFLRHYLQSISRFFHWGDTMGHLLKKNLALYWFHTCISRPKCPGKKKGMKIVPMTFLQKSYIPFTNWGENIRVGVTLRAENDGTISFCIWTTFECENPVSLNFLF